MGNNLFGANISKIIANALGNQVLSATLRKFTTATPTDAASAANPTVTSTDYACKGFIDSKNIENLPNTAVDSGMETIVLLGDTISNGTQKPETGDNIIIEGSTYVIGEDSIIDRDPDAATYTVRARRA